MKCTKCGSELAPNQAFCSTCGTPVPKQQDNQVNGGAINQNLGGQQSYTPPPRKKVGAAIWVILITILLIVAIVVGAVLIIKNVTDDDSSSTSSSRKKNNDDDENNSSKNSSKNKNNNTNTNNSSSKNTVSNSLTNTTKTPTTSSKSTYNVVLGSYVVKVPSNYKYELQGNTIYMTNEADTLLINMEIEEYPYSTVVAKKSEFTELMKQGGATIVKEEEKTINGTRCIVYEATLSGENFIIALVDVGSKYTALVQVVKDDYKTYDYDGLEDAVSIAASVEKSTGSTTTTTDSSKSATSTNLKSNNSLNLDSFFKS